jgi:SOS-response transcriptional repressor LexA
MVIDVNTLGKRIKALRELRGWSVYKLADESGMDKGQLGKLEKGFKANLTVETLNKLAVALEIPASQLLSQAELTQLAKPEKKSDRLLDLKRVLDKLGLKELSFVGQVWQTPVRGYVRAGSLSIAEQEEGEFLIVPREAIEAFTTKVEDVYALRVVGESLSGDGIHEGDHVLVLPTSILEHEGRIYIVSDPETGGSVIRHLSHKNGQIALASSNAEYPPLVLNQVQIIGRVIYVQPRGRAL